ncbi:hypothetical protein E6H20_10430 [Candidatus Bathyarchaeota archaeon]|nr:MAG: hypothetical protein E6H20_10430 [Candidatus Bathyarchaeota archaeon]
MADTVEKPRKRRSLGGWKFIVAIVLILGYSAAAAYGVMSDTSIRGLTAKTFSVSRYCTTQSSSLKTLNYNVRGAIWTASSIQTSLSHLTFTLSVDGSAIGTNSQGDSSFAPGQSVPFNLVFTHPTLNPTTLPLSSRLVLTVSATVAAGLYSANEAASDSTLQTFSSPGC